MTMADENNEIVEADAQVTDSDFPNSLTEQPVKVKPVQDQPEPMVTDVSNLQSVDKQVDPHPPNTGDQVELEHSSVELDHPEPPGEDAVHLPAASSEDIHPQSVNSVVVHSQSVSVSAEQVDSQQPVQAPPPVSAEFHHLPVGEEVVHPLGSIDENNEMIDSEQADAQETEQPEFASSGAESSVMVKPERANSQPVVEEHVSCELAHPEPLGEEVVYSPQVGSEDVHPQLLNAGHVHLPVSSESMHEQTVSPENMDSQPMTSENMDSQPMTSDPMDSQPMTSDPMDSQPMTSDLMDSQPLMQSHNNFTSEFEHPQGTSAELVVSHPATTMELVVHPQAVTSSELVHLQHGNLEPVHLQPVGVEVANLHAHGHGGEQLINSHGVGMELVNQPPLCTEIVPNSENATPEIQPSKRRKKKSIVWEHFTIETVGAGCRRAYCKVCKQSFAYSTGSKVAGTSHLKRHIAKGTCPVVLRQQEKNQLSPYMPKSGATDAGTTEHQPKRRYRSSSAPYLIFDQDRCRHEIAKMIILHDYQLHMVEHPGFVSFVQNLQPRFDMVSFNIVQGDCVAIFLREKQNLQRFIEEIPGRICLSLDMLTSSQSTGYVFVTGQFIDNDWKLHRRLLNVVMEPFPESDRALSHAIGTCLSDWGLDRKLASITFNQPLGEAALENLRALLAVKNPMLLNGQLLVRSCIARTLSSMAQEVIACSDDTIQKIRTSVKYVKTSESHEEKFAELKQQLQVPTEKTLSLDNITKWNTTYEMLVAAAELQEVFSCLDTCDPDYKDAPSKEDWKQVEHINSYLQLFYGTASLLIAKPTPSSNVFFHEVWKIQLELARAAASDDLFVAGLAKPLQDKFHKYWKNSCLVLAVAVSMDPRFKMKLVEFSFTKIFMDEAPVFIRIVDEGIHDLYQEYASFPLPLTPVEGEAGVKVENQQAGNLLNSNGLADFDMYIMETTSQQMKSELDQYLEESLLPRVQDFDVLGWWKLNKLKYPTLSKMARDILSLPLSTVSVESVFDTSVKEMDSYRCSLRPETLEALVCAKDWLQQPDSTSDSKELVKMEQL